VAAENHPVQLACRILDVSESGYYARKSRASSPRAIRHAWLTDVIREIHRDSRGVYGARRVRAELTLGRGAPVGHCAVQMLMARAGIAGAAGRPRYRKIPHVATASDLVVRDFSRDGPDQLWVTDITEHPTREGKIYCAVVLDAYSRKVVGWSIDSNQETSLVTNALLRQYFPKGTDLSRWDAEDIDAVASMLNSRPRKALGWKTLAEAFDEHLRLLQQAGVASID